VRYTRDVGPGNDGVRITLRRRLDGGALSDVVGDLLSWDGGVVRVRDRHGDVHEVDEGDIVAAKRVPPPPVRRPAVPPR
jgi:hypothetical protein